MALFLLSFAGIPLTAGFIGKFEAFRAALDSGAWPLVLIAVIAAIASVFFYVRLIVLMFFTDVPEGAEETIGVDYSPLARAVVVLTAILVIVLGILPGWFLDAANDAAVLLVGAAG
jgi:NADH-quinone oxidoreductase subunit N